jgi:hypothetical protein
MLDELEPIGVQVCHRQLALTCCLTNTAFSPVVEEQEILQEPLEVSAEEELEPFVDASEPEVSVEAPRSRVSNGGALRRSQRIAKRNPRRSDRLKAKRLAALQP